MERRWCSILFSGRSGAAPHRGGPRKTNALHAAGQSLIFGFCSLFNCLSFLTAQVLLVVIPAPVSLTVESPHPDIQNGRATFIIVAPTFLLILHPSEEGGAVGRTGFRIPCRAARRIPWPETGGAVLRAPRRSRGIPGTTRQQARHHQARCHPEPSPPAHPHPQTRRNWQNQITHRAYVGGRPSRLQDGAPFSPEILSDFNLSLCHPALWCATPAGLAQW